MPDPVATAARRCAYYQPCAERPKSCGYCATHCLCGVTDSTHDSVYPAGQAGQWWYRCDRGHGLWGPFKAAEHARLRQDEHRRLHALSVEDEREQVAAR